MSFLSDDPPVVNRGPPYGPPFPLDYSRTSNLKLDAPAPPVKISGPKPILEYPVIEIPDTLTPPEKPKKLFRPPDFLRRSHTLEVLGFKAKKNTEDKEKPKTGLTRSVSAVDFRTLRDGLTEEERVLREQRVLAREKKRAEEEEVEKRRAKYEEDDDMPYMGTPIVEEIPGGAASNMESGSPTSSGEATLTGSGSESDEILYMTTKKGKRKVARKLEKKQAKLSKYEKTKLKQAAKEEMAKQAIEKVKEDLAAAAEKAAEKARVKIAAQEEKAKAKFAAEEAKAKAKIAAKEEEAKATVAAHELKTRAKLAREEEEAKIAAMEEKRRATEDQARAKVAATELKARAKFEAEEAKAKIAVDKVRAKLAADGAKARLAAAKIQAKHEADEEKARIKLATAEEKAAKVALELEELKAKLALVVEEGKKAQQLLAELNADPEKAKDELAKELNRTMEELDGSPRCFELPMKPPKRKISFSTVIEGLTSCLDPTAGLDSYMPIRRGSKSSPEGSSEEHTEKDEAKDKEKSPKEYSWKNSIFGYRAPSVEQAAMPASDEEAAFAGLTPDGSEEETETVKLDSKPEKGKEHVQKVDIEKEKISKVQSPAWMRKANLFRSKSYDDTTKARSEVEVSEKQDEDKELSELSTSLPNPGSPLMTKSRAEKKAEKKAAKKAAKKQDEDQEISKLSTSLPNPGSPLMTKSRAEKKAEKKAAKKAAKKQDEDQELSKLSTSLPNPGSPLLTKSKAEKKAEKKAAKMEAKSKGKTFLTPLASSKAKGKAPKRKVAPLPVVPIDSGSDSEDNVLMVSRNSAAHPSSSDVKTDKKDRKASKGLKQWIPVTSNFRPFRGSPYVPSHIGNDESESEADDEDDDDVFAIKPEASTGDSKPKERGGFFKTPSSNTLRSAFHTFGGKKKQDREGKVDVKGNDTKKLKGILLSPPGGFTRSSSAQEVPTVSTIDTNANQERPRNRRATTEQRVRFDENTQPTRNAHHAEVPSGHPDHSGGLPTPPEQTDDVSAAIFLHGLPSPVSPPDPDYIAQIEREMEEKMAMGYYKDEPTFRRRQVEQRSLLSQQLSGVKPDPNLQPPQEPPEIPTQDMTEEEKFFARVGPISNWGQYPPVQVAEGYIPESKKHWNWNGGEMRGYVPDWEGLGESSSAVEHPSTF